MPGFFFKRVSVSLECLLTHCLLPGFMFNKRQKEHFSFSLAPGTYCQQREVEAITEGVEDDDGMYFPCCCVRRGVGAGAGTEIEFEPRRFAPVMAVPLDVSHQSWRFLSFQVVVAASRAIFLTCFLSMLRLVSGG